jgi:hypothetical protein
MTSLSSEPADLRNSAGHQGVAPIVPKVAGLYSRDMTVRREKLYEEVWAEPMTTVAARYGVSGNFLARVCHALNVPHPLRGYWAKSKVGKEPPRPELPPPTAGHATEWTRGTMPHSRTVGLSEGIPPPGLKRRRWARPPRHSLIEGVAELFQRGRTSESGYLRPLKRTLPDVFASTTGLADALTLASELYLAMEDRGYKVTLATDGMLHRRPGVDHRGVEAKDDPYTDHRERWVPGRLTVAALGPLAIGLTIYELSERIEVRLVKGEWLPVATSPPERWQSRSRYDRDYTAHKDRPTGRFVVRAYSPYGFADWAQEWREDKPGQLLKRLKRICADIEDAAPRVAAMIEEGRRKAEDERRKWEAEMRETERRREEERRVEAHKQSRDGLLAVIAAWGDVLRLEGFFADAERRVNELPEERRARLSERLARARHAVGSVDALRHLESWRTPEEVFEALTADARRRLW